MTGLMLKGIYHLLIPVPLRAAIRTFLIFNFEYGYWRSADQQRPMDNAGNALPWLTYPAIDFLSRLDFSTKSVFEYGSGSSTIWWSKRARDVTAVESDPQWFETVKASTPINCQLGLFITKNDYVHSISRAGHKYDVIVIDGAWRRECAHIAPTYLSEGGLIILDNTDWYPFARATMRTHDQLLEVDFSGFAPAQACTGTTSIWFDRSCRFSYRADHDSFQTAGSIRQLHEPVPEDGV